jgi:class 3 adenylate cyclase
VYSTAKGVDFATDLNAGPYSGTTLASLVRAVSNNPERGVVSVADLAAYVPDLGQPVGFFASPIFDGDTLVGILAVKIPVDEINQIMTFNGKWVEEGFGETGETFLMGGDGRMRSISRFWLDDPTAYLEAANAAGTITVTEGTRMEATDTTIVHQRVAHPDAVAAARSPDHELEEATNYLGAEVRFTAEHLEIEGLDWFVVSSIATAELNEPLDNFRTAVLIAVALFVVTITFITVGWAREMFRPIREISERLRRVHEHEEDEPVEIPKRSPTEFKELAANLDRMIDVSTARQDELEAAVKERFDTVRSLLPPSISARLEAGDTEVLDRVPNASVIVLAIGGLGDLVHLPVEDSRRLLDRAIDELDAVGARHGVERAKLVGDVYYAGCGLNQWYLDHAPRAVAFAREAIDALQALVAGESIDLTIATGIKSGPVTIGLAGSTRLVYDLWGDTVDGAHFLARSAGPGEILIADATRALIPAEQAVVPWRGTTTASPVWEIVQVPATTETSL